jgi:hypothetical protein
LAPWSLGALEVGALELESDAMRCVAFDSARRLGVKSDSATNCQNDAQDKAVAQTELQLYSTVQWQRETRQSRANQGKSRPDRQSEENVQIQG